jgi:hypothetical protein
MKATDFGFILVSFITNTHANGLLELSNGLHFNIDSFEISVTKHCLNPCYLSSGNCDLFIIKTENVTISPPGPKFLAHFRHERCGFHGSVHKLIGI